MSRHIGRFAGFASLALAAASLLAPAATAGAAVSPCGAGILVPSPSLDTFDSLSGIAVAGPRDAWVVGRYTIPSTSGIPSRALVEHWTGTRWLLVKVPQPKAFIAGLAGITAVSATDIWAVGSTENARQEDDHTLIEHWDGKAWRIMPGSVAGALTGVAAASASDVWAVGGITRADSAGANTLTEHWDGTRWRVVPSPSPGQYGDYLHAVTVAGPNSVWAAGDTVTSRFGTAVAFTERWNGTAWSAVPTPGPGQGSELRAAASAGGNDVWVAGYYSQNTPTGTVDLTLTEHWTGTRWTVVGSPSPSGDDVFGGLAAVSATDIWAVGGQAGASLVAHWTGHVWVQVAAPNRPHTVGVLGAVSAASATDVWAAGDDISLHDYSYHTLTENICPG